MGENSGIQWTDHTFNPWVGCQRVSPGCENCYAEAYDKRVGGLPKSQRKDPNVQELRWGPKAPRVRTSPANWAKPLKWNADAQESGKRARVFCSSLADVFEDRPELALWRLELFDLIFKTPHLDWMLLTKRPENVRSMLVQTRKDVALLPESNTRLDFWMSLDEWADGGGGSPPNVWLGATAENEEWLHKRLPALLRAPARVRFLSCEPLLGPIDPYFFEMAALDMVIVGGESGPKARPFDVVWADTMVKWGRDTNTAIFVKQMGSKPFNSRVRGYESSHPGGAVADPECQWHLVDHHGGDMNEWPKELRVRQLPGDLS